MALLPLHPAVAGLLDSLATCREGVALYVGLRLLDSLPALEQTLLLSKCCSMMNLLRLVGGSHERK
jgi:hypothetical protein